MSNKNKLYGTKEKEQTVRFDLKDERKVSAFNYQLDAVDNFLDQSVMPPAGNHTTQNRSKKNIVI